MKKITYKYKFEDGREKVFDFEWDKDSYELKGVKPEKLPHWTLLNYHQCPNCPSSVHEDTHCPMAVSLVNLVKYFDGMKSFEKVFVEVYLDKKVISKHTSVQKAVGSMMGLVSAMSGCPISAYFKPMAFFHLPFSDRDSTIYRATSMYFLAQYFKHKKSGEFDFDLKGLKKIYKDIGTMNSSIANRLRDASKTDSTVNAIIGLDIYAKSVPIYIEKLLKSLEELFDAYLN
ncbi:MAG: hypothetical protein PF574_05800 [Candidatus Delongbacteria bacterium]|nr:hypothetical protein [Candidatus Delongbacteria bacterium]